MQKQRILFLTLNVFSKTGGIEKACRAMIYALHQLKDIDITTWSLYDNTNQIDERYTPTSKFSAFAEKSFHFGFSIIKNSLKFDTIILSHINLLLFAKLIKTIKPSTRIILWAHGIEIWRPIPKWKKKFLQEKIEIWAVSHFTKKEIVQKHQVDESRIQVLNNCLNPFLEINDTSTKSRYLTERYQIKNNTFVLYSLTRLSNTEHQKNYDSVINIIAKLQNPNILYLIGGKADKEEEERLENLIRKLNLIAQVKLLSFIKDEELMAHYQTADCFILPSQKEGFGIAFIEAAAAGCQVIGGNIDGSTDALLDGRLGQLVNPNDEEEIENVIKKAISNTSHDRKKQQDLALAHFGFDGYVEKVRTLLN